MVTRVNIYRNGQQWSYAAFDGREFDHSDVLMSESETDAKTELLDLFPLAKVVRVADTNNG